MPIKPGTHRNSLRSRPCFGAGWQLPADVTRRDAMRRLRMIREGRSEKAKTMAAIGCDRHAGQLPGLLRIREKVRRNRLHRSGTGQAGQSARFSPGPRFPTQWCGAGVPAPRRCSAAPGRGLPAWIPARFPAACRALPERGAHWRSGGLAPRGGRFACSRRCRTPFPAGCRG